jgi:hypothetical protein
MFASSSTADALSDEVCRLIALEFGLDALWELYAGR